jgi:hypothetical protein
VSDLLSLVDPAKLNTLKELINAPNYKENMATLIR